MTEQNVLLITTDQQHWQTLGIFNPHIDTPNLDRLANEGTVFTRAYCPNPTCTPTRASIITGKYPSQHGAYSLGTKLMESENTVGDAFSDAGYKTSLVGKAHFQPLKSTAKYPSLESYPIMQDLDFWRDFDGPFYGFEHVELARNHVDEAHAGQHYALWMEDNGLTNWRDYFRPPTGNRTEKSRRWKLPEKYHYNNWIAERSCALMGEYKGSESPFFLWSSFFDPHPAYLVPEPWYSMYDPEKITVPEISEGEHDKNPPHFRLTQEENPDFSSYKETGGNGIHGGSSHLHDKKELAKDIAVYYGMVSCLDKYVGKILDKLSDLGLRESTLIVFTTDHGHLYGQHGLTAKGPFHYEDLLRVPFIVSQPGTVPGQRQNDAIQSLVDLPRSFLSHCGIAQPEEMTGVDQSPVWTGNTTKARDHAIVENRHQPTTLNLKTYVGERYKITVYYNRPYGEIFDLEEDPGEKNNLWNSKNHRELKSELLLKLISAEMGKEPLLMPRIAGA